MALMVAADGDHIPKALRWARRRLDKDANDKHAHSKCDEHEEEDHRDQQEIRQG